MIWFVLVGFLAAVGFLTILWLCAGFFVPTCRRGTVGIHCPQGAETALLRRYCWLRDLGFVRCRIVLLDSALSPQEQKALTEHYPGVAFATKEQWNLDRERK